MKREILTKLTLIFLLAALAGTVFAQSGAPEPSPQTAPIMSEDDRLPFMQSEEKPEMQETGSGGLILRTIGSMILIVGLIFLGAWGLKKSGFGALKTNAAGSPDLAVVSTVSLGNGRSISTVRFGEKILLVGSTAQSFTLLAESAGTSKPAAADTESDLNPRSVAELLAEEEKDFTMPDDFGEEFARAEQRLDALREDGGKLR